MTFLQFFKLDLGPKFKFHTLSELNEEMGTMAKYYFTKLADHGYNAEIHKKLYRILCNLPANGRYGDHETNSNINFRLDPMCDKDNALTKQSKEIFDYLKFYK